MNYKEIKELIDLIKETDVAEIEVERAGTRIRIRRDGQGGPVREIRDVAPPPPTAPAEPASPGPAAAQPEEEAGVVHSPLVGTFYRSPGPDTPPFTDLGERVEKGQVLCIVEAMKLMNEIEAEFAGIVREVFVENGQPVEYGQPLYRIEPEA